MNKYSALGDAVAPSELLKALNTLQLYNCNEDNDLSFRQHTFKVPHTSQRTMNFQLYMEKQTDKGGNNRTKNLQKSVSPLKDMTRSFAKTSELSNNKRNSLTPVNRCSASKVLAKKKVQDKETKQKQTDKQNRERNIQKTASELNRMSKVSSFSKKLLDQRQKKGNAYVPIQIRADILLKERQAKLAKLQKEREIQKMIEEKQCTFKPKISKSYVKCDPQIKKNEKTLCNVKVQEQQSKIIQQQKTVQIDSSGNLQASVQSIELKQPKIQTQKQQEVKIAKDAKPERIGFKKYKNQKFNSLLDFLH